MPSAAASAQQDRGAADRVPGDKSPTRSAWGCASLPHTRCGFARLPAAAVRPSGWRLCRHRSWLFAHSASTPAHSASLVCCVRSGAARPQPHPAGAFPPAFSLGFVRANALRQRSLSAGLLALPLSLQRPSVGRPCSVRGRAVQLPSARGETLAPSFVRFAHFRPASGGGCSCPAPAFPAFRRGQGFFCCARASPACCRVSGAAACAVSAPGVRGSPPSPPRPCAPAGGFGGRVARLGGLRPPLRGLRFSQPSCGSPPAGCARPGALIRARFTIRKL